MVFHPDSNLSKSDASFNGQTTLYAKQTIWNDNQPKEDEVNQNNYQMKFLNYNNKFLLKKEDQPQFKLEQKSKGQEKKPFNLNEIIAANTNKEISQQKHVPDYSEDFEEGINKNPVNITSTKTNNLSSINQRGIPHEVIYARSFTEPSAEAIYTNYSSNHSNQSGNKFNIPENQNKRMFPTIGGASYCNEDSFDFSVNEE